MANVMNELKAAARTPALVSAAVSALLLAGCGGDPQAPIAEPPGTAARTDQPSFAQTPANAVRLEHLRTAVARFTLYHELGHMVLHEFNLPVLGREEDAADRFATAIMKPAPRRAGQGPESFDPALEENVPEIVWSIGFWRFLYQSSVAAGQEPAWWDEHGLDEQRARQIACLVYGADPARFEESASFRMLLPPERRASCVPEAAQNQQVWSQLLGSQIAEPTQIRYRAQVRYEEAPAPYAAQRDWLAASGVLESIAAEIGKLRISGAYNSKIGPDVLKSLRENPYRIEVAAEGCQAPDGTFEENAFWDGSGRRIVFCYALAAEIDRFAREMLSGMPRAQ